MPVWLAPAIIAAANVVTGLIAQHKQNKANKKLAQQQASANEAYQAQQNEYNTPQNQMARYQQAGLNPNLIYSQGNSGNQTTPLSYPSYERDESSALRSIGPAAQQSLMATYQLQATSANIRKTYQQTALAKLQADVLKKNPLLNEAAFNATISSLISAAEIKASESKMKGQEATWKTGEMSWKDPATGTEWHGPAGAIMMEKQLQILAQKYQLNEADQKIKAQVLESKEFANDLAEIQRNWMKDGSITPQHIYQFIQLLIMKLF